MSPVNGVTAEGGSSTVFTVLAHAARSHSRRYLAIECLVALSFGTLVIVWQAQWWPVASIAAGVSLYAAWGLAAEHGVLDAARWRARLCVSVAALATAATC